MARRRCVVLHVVKCGARAVPFSLSFFLHVVVFVVAASPEVPFPRSTKFAYSFKTNKGVHFGYGAPNAFDWLKLSSLRSGKMPRW